MNRCLHAVLAGVVLWFSACASPPSDETQAPATVVATPANSPAAAPADPAPPTVDPDPLRAAPVDPEIKLGPESAVADILIGDRREQAPRGTEAAPRDEGPVDLAPEAWDLSAYVRPLRRVTVRQLRQAIRDATGGAGWTTRGVDKWGPLEPTLGVPDWLLRVTAETRPNATFNKFLRDAAIETCLPLVSAEMADDFAAADRVILRHADPNQAPGDDQATRDTLAYLLLRFHGQRETTDSAEVDRWVQMISQVVTETGSATQAWQATCVALITHPRFYVY